MTQLINQHSYIFAALVVLVIALGIAYARFRASPRAWIALIALAGLLVAGNLLFSDGASDIETVAQFDALLATRQPILLEIYSNY